MSSEKKKKKEKEKKKLLNNILLLETTSRLVILFPQKEQNIVLDLISIHTKFWLVLHKTLPSSSEDRQI